MKLIPNSECTLIKKIIVLDLDELVYIAKDKKLTSIKSITFDIANSYKIFAKYGYVINDKCIFFEYIMSYDIKSLEKGIRVSCPNKYTFIETEVMETKDFKRKYNFS